VSDVFYAGWEAEVDGRPAPIFRADYGLRGVYVPAGTHRIRFLYRPASLAWGAALTGAGLLMLAGLFAAPRAGKPRRRGRGNAGPGPAAPEEPPAPITPIDGGSATC